MNKWICIDLYLVEKAVNKIQKVVTKQDKFNNKVALFAVAFAVTSVISDIQYREQANRIDKLEKEVKELKEQRGE